MMKKVYENIRTASQSARVKLGRPLTLTEKILYAHLDNPNEVGNIERGKSFSLLRPDRVAMQDATAQMAILQFIQSGRERVAVPSTVHCDHLIRAHEGSDKDMDTANKENAEVYNFLSTASQKYGIGFWGPGSGIIHQVVLENYAAPGMLMIGTDSHTPNGGGLGALAIGVGGADAVDVMAGQAWELLFPKVIAVKLTGKFDAWTSPKDVILKVLEILTVKGGTNKIVEYIGPGADNISCTGKATITNMGAELGATTSVFGFDAKMKTYLEATERADLASLADQYGEDLRPDPEVVADAHKYYDEVIEIDLDALEPYIVGPHSPDKARPLSAFKDEIDKEGYPNEISACLIGSCTNSSYEDIYKAAGIAEQAMKLGIKASKPLFVSPGSTRIYATIKRDGLMQTLEKFGATVLANACGPCIGQWKRDDIKQSERNSIVTSFNRNFRGRNDANAETLSFISSPEMVLAYATSGKLDFNPRKDEVIDAGGQAHKLSIPAAPELPDRGFVHDKTGYLEPAVDGGSVAVDVKPDSERLQILSPFAAWDGKDYEKHRLLVKVVGKCTTDHISPAGTWLRFRGHLENISNNMLLGGVNAFSNETGKTNHQLSGDAVEQISSVAKAYKNQGQRWVIVGDENYGEGSSREHAAMCPRFLGASTVIVRSFARIHETNLKKQGVLALTFQNSADYDKVRESDLISITGLDAFAPGKPLAVVLTHADGSKDEILAAHSYNHEQIKWFKAGSSLNTL
ncbi:MAG: aconitate hydratase [Zetaproteobacteria bacterium]|nr:aconitate hydratase [Zetaproteobacteria bacterium]